MICLQQRANPQRVLEEDKVPEVWESLVGIRKHSSSRDRVTSQQSSGSLWRRWQSSSCQKGDLREHRGGGTCWRCWTAWETKYSCRAFFFFPFLLWWKAESKCKILSQGHILRLPFNWAEQLLGLRQTQPWCCRLLLPLGISVSHILHLKLCCQRILLKLWLFYTWVSFFPPFWSRGTSQRGA